MRIEERRLITFNRLDLERALCRAAELPADATINALDIDPMGATLSVTISTSDEKSTTR